MWYYSEQRVILIGNRSTDDEDWTHFGGDTRLSEPDLTAFWIGHGPLPLDPLTQTPRQQQRPGRPLSKCRRYHRTELRPFGCDIANAQLPQLRAIRQC